MQSDDPELIVMEGEELMDKAVEAATEHLAKIRTGRAHTGMVENLKVDYYGALTPLKQLANLGTPDGRTIAIQPFDPGASPAIEKAIAGSDLGLTPNVSKEGIIHINIPELSEERRKELIKVARSEAENGRISVRNSRRDANEAIKKLEKDGTVSEDDARRYLDQIQELTDGHVDKIDKLLEQKEADLLKV